MNLSRTAIRYAVNRNSAATSLRLCLRFLALWMLVWAASEDLEWINTVGYLPF